MSSVRLLCSVRLLPSSFISQRAVHVFHARTAVGHAGVLAGLFADMVCMCCVSCCATGCKTCSSSGVKPGTTPSTCSMCQGTGQLIQVRGAGSTGHVGQQCEMLLILDLMLEHCPPDRC